MSRIGSAALSLPLEVKLMQKGILSLVCFHAHSHWLCVGLGTKQQAGPI